MYIAKIPNRKSPPAILLRESYRQAGRVKTRTLANLTKLPTQAIEVLRRVLKGETLVPADQAFEVLSSYHHGHVQAVLDAMRQLGFSSLLASRSSHQRNLVLAMVAARIVLHNSKLATTRQWQITTLPSMLGVTDADEDDLYDAMDWLLQRQDRIESKLAARHLKEGGIALYDLTSSYFEGLSCPLAARGYDRDGKKGKLQVNYGLLTDDQGRPVSVSVFEGNTGDPKTLVPQVEKARQCFGLKRMVIVGDRGMITQKQINVLERLEGIDWITALRPEAIRKLVACSAVQIGLFDERNLFELTHPDFPGERLVACRNPDLAKKRAHKRKRLLEATSSELDKVRRMVQRDRLRGKEQIARRVGSILDPYRIGKHFKVDIHDDGFDFEVPEQKIATPAPAQTEGDTESTEKRRTRDKRHIETLTKKLEALRRRIERGRLHGKDEIGLRVGRVFNKYRVAKHFKLDIREAEFDFEIDQDKVAAEAALDGIYVVRTNLSADRMTAEDAVRSYKLLGQVERAFRAFKSIDLMVRPIRHWLEDRVRAHIFLCMLAYYVQWHMIEVWRPLLFCDEDQAAKKTRDPVAPAKRSDAALHKVHSKALEDGSVVHSFQTLLTLLSGIVRNVCRVPGDDSDGSTFDVVTKPNSKQQSAFDLLKTISA